MPNAVTTCQNLSQKSSYVPTALQLCTLRSPAGLAEVSLNLSRTRVQESPLLGKVTAEPGLAFLWPQEFSFSFRLGTLCSSGGVGDTHLPPRETHS